MSATRQMLLDTLRGRASDGVSILCPGGMMTLAVTEVMEAEGVWWPDAHGDPVAMASLAVAMHDATGFDNIAMPFCMTVEAECCGASVDLGSATVSPRVKGFVLPPDGSGALREPRFTSGRAGVLLAAIRQASVMRRGVPIIGNLVGPFSLLAMLADPLQVLRWTRRKPDVLRAHLDAVTKGLIEFGRMQIESGADVICIAEPTATGEILGARLFESFALPAVERIVKSLKDAGAAVILHVCGDARPILPELRRLCADAVSFDSIVDIVEVNRSRPPWRVMGNVSPFLLASGSRDAVRDACEALLDGGIRLIAPACGVIPTTPVAHLAVMAETVASARRAHCPLPNVE